MLYKCWRSWWRASEGSSRQRRPIPPPRLRPVRPVSGFSSGRASAAWLPDDTTSPVGVRATAVRSCPCSHTMLSGSSASLSCSSRSCRTWSRSALYHSTRSVRTQTRYAPGDPGELPPRSDAYNMRSPGLATPREVESLTLDAARCRGTHGHISWCIT